VAIEHERHEPSDSPLLLSVKPRLWRSVASNSQNQSQILLCPVIRATKNDSQLWRAPLDRPFVRACVAENVTNGRTEPGRDRERSVVGRIDAGVLLGTAREVIVVHGETEYRLRLTKNDKLILTK
jgi:hemin uptake protein HemP